MLIELPYGFAVSDVIAGWIGYVPVGGPDHIVAQRCGIPEDDYSTVVHVYDRSRAIVVCGVAHIIAEDEPHRSADIARCVAAEYVKWLCCTI